MTDGKKLDQGMLWEEYYTNLHRAYQAMGIAFANSGLTQDELAEKLGIDKSLISKRLNGSENLTLKTLSFMATALNCRLKIEPLPYQQIVQSVAQPRNSALLRSAHLDLKPSVLDGYSHATKIISRQFESAVSIGSQSSSRIWLASISRSPAEEPVQSKPKRSVSERRHAA